MKVIYKTLIVSLLAVSTGAMANKLQDLKFDLEAQIPADRSYVKFSDPSFDTTTQTMAWDDNRGVLSNLTTSLQARNTEGKIEAYLQTDAELVHTVTPATKIPLTISIDGRPLGVGSSQAIEMLDDTAANTEKTLPLVVSPTGTPAYDAGDYTGTVTMVFDHET